MLLTEQVLLERIDDMVSVSRRFAQQKLTNKARLQLQKSMEMMFKAQQKTVLKQLAKLRDMFEESIKSGDLDSIFMLAENKTSTAAEKALNKAAQDGLLKGSKALISELNVNMMFDLSNPAAVDYLNRFGAKKVTQINDSTRKYINGVVKQSADEGWSYNRTAKAIGERYNQMWVGKPQQHIASRAHFIAVTEAGNAYMEGQMMVGFDLDAVGLNMEKSWSTMNDANVSDGCADNQGAGWINVKKAFPSGHLRPLRFPGCRCDLLQRVAEGARTTDLPTDFDPVNYREFSEYDAISELNPHYEDWAKNIPDTHEWAIEGYSNGFYSDANAGLRAGFNRADFIAEFGDEIGEDLADVVDWLEQAIKAAPPSPDDILLHRGFSSEDVWKLLDDGELGVGDIIEEAQFLSTSTSAEIGESFVKGHDFPIEYRIQTPKGTRMAYIEDLSQYGGEYEAILAPGTHLEIMGIETVSAGEKNLRQVVTLLIK